jgi:hypothetical protein
MKQRKVLANTLAWIGPVAVFSRTAERFGERVQGGRHQERFLEPVPIREFEPSEEDVEQFFAWNDHGVLPSSLGVVDLMRGWLCHYGDEYAWIEDYEKRGANPPTIPPQSWVYESCWRPEEWLGWAQVIRDFMYDRLNQPETWRRSKPAYRRAQVMRAYHEGRIGLARFKCLLKGQKA